LIVGAGLLLHIKDTVKQINILSRFPEEKKEQAINETSGWQIYRNKQYGFEIKYPISSLLDWTVLRPKHIDWDMGKMPQFV
jgi:hypothetical protein